MKDEPMTPTLRHFSGMLTSLIGALLKERDVSADQHQANGLHGIHQLRVRLPNDPVIYRVIVCPADAPLWVDRDNPWPIDNHFPESIYEGQ